MIWHNYWLCLMSYEFYIVTFILFVQNGTKKVRFQLELKYLVLEI